MFHSPGLVDVRLLKIKVDLTDRCHPVVHSLSTKADILRFEDEEYAPCSWGSFAIMEKTEYQNYREIYGKYASQYEKASLTERTPW